MDVTAIGFTHSLPSEQTKAVPGAEPPAYLAGPGRVLGNRTVYTKGGTDLNRQITQGASPREEAVVFTLLRVKNFTFISRRSRAVRLVIPNAPGDSGNQNCFP